MKKNRGKPGFWGVHPAMRPIIAEERKLLKDIREGKVDAHIQKFLEDGGFIDKQPEQAAYNPFSAEKRCTATSALKGVYDE